MSDSTIVHLLRHGEVENPAGIVYGRLPGYHLSANGRAMAAAAADYFAGRPVVALFCSPLERAQETARPVAERLGLEIVTDDRLIESWNHFEGMKFGVGDGSLRRPAHWPHLINPFRPSWGEPYHDVAARMLAMMETAREAAAGPGGGVRQPPAAHLGDPADGRAQAAVAQPDHARMRAGQRDELHLHGRPAHRGLLHRAGPATGNPGRCGTIVRYYPL